MLELDLKISAKQALAACRGRGLVIQSERALAARPGSHHWHLRIPGRAGTLELNEWHERVWVKVHPRREGDWASDLAHELAARAAPSPFLPTAAPDNGTPACKHGDPPAPAP
jgi:hypothetical protein